MYVKASLSTAHSNMRTCHLDDSHMLTKRQATVKDLKKRSDCCAAKFHVQAKQLEKQPNYSNAMVHDKLYRLLFELSSVPRPAFARAARNCFLRTGCRSRGGRAGRGDGFSLRGSQKKLLSSGLEGFDAITQRPLS